MYLFVFFSTLLHADDWDLVVLRSHFNVSLTADPCRAIVIWQQFFSNIFFDAMHTMCAITMKTDTLPHREEHKTKAISALTNNVDGLKN